MPTHSSPCPLLPPSSLTWPLCGRTDAASGRWCPSACRWPPSLSSCCWLWWAVLRAASGGFYSHWTGWSLPCSPDGGTQEKEDGLRTCSFTSQTTRDYVYHTFNYFSTGFSKLTFYHCCKSDFKDRVGLIMAQVWINKRRFSYLKFHATYHFETS